MTQLALPVQQSQSFEMPSGASLHITVAPFQDAWALMRASLKTLKGMNLKSEDLKQDMGALLGNPSALALILDRVVDFATSPDVESAIWKCANRALYIPAGSPVEFPGTKVCPNLFDDPEYGNMAREDYAKIVTSLLEVNCKPFLAKALSGFLKPNQKNAESLKSELI